MDYDIKAYHLMGFLFYYYSSLCEFWTFALLFTALNQKVFDLFLTTIVMSCSQRAKTPVIFEILFNEFSESLKLILNYHQFKFSRLIETEGGHSQKKPCLQIECYLYFDNLIDVSSSCCYYNPSYLAFKFQTLRFSNF